MTRNRVLSPVGETLRENVTLPATLAGGPGKHSAVVPNCAFSRAVTAPIRDPGARS